MNKEQFEAFLERHDLRNDEIAEILGVTQGAISHWLVGRRDMSLMMVRLLKLFDKRPELMAEFKEISK